MSSLFRFATGSSVVLIACLLTGCGQTGPLYLPKVPAPVTTPNDPSIPDAPQKPAPTNTVTQ